ncbi:RNA polymerase sigma factor [Nonomuraea jiangxiensis]|nr:RNA polymerase sigma factor [Nonomuraea jiangxiensis]
MSDQHSERSPINSAAGTHRAVREAFVSFTENEYPRLKVFLMRYGASHEDSDDAAQEAFLEAWRLLTNRPSQWISIREPGAWIRTVATRALTRPRGQNRRQIPTIPFGSDPTDHDQMGHDWAEQVALESDVRAALHALPPDQRLAMAYRMDDFKYAIIAEQMGLTEQQARDLIKKARATMKKILGSHLNENKETSDHLRLRRYSRADD